MGSYSKDDQIGPKKQKDTRSFREKYNTPLKKKPYKLKRTPLKPSTKPISPISDKQKKKRQEVAKAVENKLQNTTHLFCQACGRSDTPLDPSHLLAQGIADEYAADANNIHWHCRYPCHDDCETMKFYKMRDGLKIMEKLYHMGEKGRQRLRSALNAWDGMNLDLWKQSSLYGEEYLF